MRTSTYILLIILVTLAVYSNSFENRFVWDDIFLIAKNPAIMSWKFAWTHFAVDLYHSFSNYYRPVQMISYMIDFSLWRLNPFGYHLTNVLLHICVSLSLFMLLRLMTGDKRIAFIGALFYAVHPAHTAAVTYIAGRADSLATFFSLLSLILFHQHFKTRKNNTALFLYVSSLILFLFALLSKEMAIVIPAIILFYRLFFISDDEVGKSRSVIKFHYISWFVIVLGVYVILRIYALNFQEGVLVLSKHSLYLRLLTSLKALGIYFGIIFLPLYMQMERSIPYVSSFFEIEILLSGLLFLFMLWLVARIRKVSKQASFGFLFFIIALLPVANIYPMSNNIAEHWLYTPMVGMSIFLSCLGVKFWDNKRSLRSFLTFFVTGYLIFFSYQTFDRNFDWRNEYTIYTHTLNYNPKSIKVLNNIGNLYHENGNLDLAVVFHKKAIERNPKEHKTRLNLGFDYEAMGMLEKALAQYKLSVRLKPNYAKGHFRIGGVYMKMDNMDMAIHAYKQAARYDELHVDARTYLGNIYFTKGYFKKAKEEYENAIKINPYLPDIHNNFGNTLSKLGLHKEAIEEHKKAIELEPEEAKYHLDLGATYGEHGMYDEAIIELKQAYQLKPWDVDTLINLGAAYYYKGDIELARNEWQRALIVDPQNPIAKRYLTSIQP